MNQPPGNSNWKGGTMLMPQGQQGTAPVQAPPQGYGGAPPAAAPQYGDAGQQGYGMAPGGGYPPGGGGYPPPGGGAPPGGYGGPPPGAPPGGYGGPPPGAPPGGYGGPPGGAPPPGYGAPQQQPPPQQGGMQGPSFGGIGIGPGGRPNISVGMGGFHPNQIIGALVSGEGFDSPRKFGAIAAGIGFAILIVEEILIHVVNIWFPWFYLIAFPLFWGGVWMLILGQPQKQQDGSKAPMWGRLVVGAVMALGLLQALFFAFVLGI